MFKFGVFLITILCMSNVHAFIAYDCSLTHVNFTKINLNEIKECSNIPKLTNQQSTTIQLIQIQDEIPVESYSCKLVINRLITYCGFSSHASQVPRGYGTPGYTASLLGEVIYVSQCQPVDVSVRHTESCFHELPVTYNNRSFFMTPRTHLLQQHGTQLTCNRLFSSMYLIEGTWYQIYNLPHESVAPLTLHPSNEQKWSYTSTKSLTTSGLYSLKELDILREHIMYGQESRAIQSIITRGYTGQEFQQQGGSLLNLLTPDGLDNLSQKLADKLWGWFSKFGTISAGLLGIIIVFKMIKWIIDTILHGALLYGIFGMSFKLVGSIWDSVTWFFIHKHTKSHYNKTNKQDSGSDDIELNKITVDTSKDTCVTSTPNLIYPLLSNYKNGP